MGTAVVRRDVYRATPVRLSPRNPEYYRTFVNVGPMSKRVNVICCRVVRRPVRVFRLSGFEHVYAPFPARVPIQFPQPPKLHHSAPAKRGGTITKTKKD